MFISFLTYGLLVNTRYSSNTYRRVNYIKCNNGLFEQWIVFKNIEDIWKLFRDLLNNGITILKAGLIDGSTYELPEFLALLDKHKGKDLINILGKEIILNGWIYVECLTHCRDYVSELVKNGLIRGVVLRRKIPNRMKLLVKELDAEKLIERGLRILKPVKTPPKLC